MLQTIRYTQGVMYDSTLSLLFQSFKLNWNIQISFRLINKMFGYILIEFLAIIFINNNNEFTLNKYHIIESFSTDAIFHQQKTDSRIIQAL